MAVSLNGYFMSLEVSARLPSLRINSAALTNIVPDHMRIENGDINMETGLAIVPDNNNLGEDATTGWHQNTEMNADFNGTLEGGTLQEFGLNVNGVVIRRTSNRSNFKEWEDVVVFPVAAGQLGALNVDYDDLYVESGVIYKYAIQPVSGANRGPLNTPKPVIFDYEYSWLIGEGEKQLMFAFNPVISSYSTVVKDTLIETIGSKYPYVVRNSNVGYKTFQFSATITHFMDVENVLTKDSTLYLAEGVTEDTSVDVSSDYTSFFEEKGMNPTDNYILEREFRNRITEFLYDGKPKVFKSDTEGLLLVKISGVSLTPKTELGRTIYDLSCTMTEIGTVDFDTLIDNKIKKGVKVSGLK